MSDQHLSERIPDVARGDAEWTAAEAAHLASCDDCAAEWRVVRAFAGGPDLTIDAGRVAERVVSRLRDEEKVVSLEARRPWRRALLGLAAAASVALAVAIWRPWLGPAEVAVAPTREPTMLPELDALFEAELEVILAAIEPEPVEPIGSVPRIGDLTDDELELLLADVEG